MVGLSWEIIIILLKKGVASDLVWHIHDGLNVIGISLGAMKMMA
jgi:hypothetical protein